LFLLLNGRAQLEGLYISVNGKDFNYSTRVFRCVRNRHYLKSGRIVVASVVSENLEAGSYRKVELSLELEGHGPMAGLYFDKFHNVFLLKFIFYSIYIIPYFVGFVNPFLALFANCSQLFFERKRTAGLRPRPRRKRKKGGKKNIFNYTRDM
jgi:hypothetical protein